MSNLYKKTGDCGQTSLLGGLRIDKDDPRVICYGTIDEANSSLGMAYALTKNVQIKQFLDSIQKKMFLLGAELASDKDGMKLIKTPIVQEDIYYLEYVVDQCTEITGVQTGFVIPGANAASASLHVARTVIRRAERIMTALSKTEMVREELLIYTNRLSDAIYALARLEEVTCDEEERNVTF